MNVNLEALMLVATEKGLTGVDLRVFLLLMSMCESGSAFIKQAHLGEILKTSRTNINASIRRLRNMGMVSKDGSEYVIDPMVIYMGRKDQLAKHIRMYQNKLKRKRREAFYAKENE